MNLIRSELIKYPRHLPLGRTHARECRLGNLIVAKISEHAIDELFPVRVCPRFGGHFIGVDDTALESTAHGVHTQRGAGFLDLKRRLADLYLDLKAVPSVPNSRSSEFEVRPNSRSSPKIKMKLVL